MLVHRRHMLKNVRLKGHDAENLLSNGLREKKNEKVHRE